MWETMESLRVFPWFLRHDGPAVIWIPLAMACLPVLSILEGLGASENVATKLTQNLTVGEAVRGRAYYVEYVIPSPDADLPANVSIAVYRSEKEPDVAYCGVLLEYGLLSGSFRRDVKREGRRTSVVKNGHAENAWVMDVDIRCLNGCRGPCWLPRYLSSSAQRVFWIVAGAVLIVGVPSFVLSFFVAMVLLPVWLGVDP